MIFSNIHEKIEIFFKPRVNEILKNKSESRRRNLQKSVVIQTKKNNNINPQNWNSTNIFIITLFSLLQKMDKVCPFHPMGEKTTEVES